MELVIGIYVVTALCVVDALRHPIAAWAEADREKSFWVVSLLLSAVFVLPAVALGVLPRLKSRGAASPSNPFAK